MYSRNNRNKYVVHSWLFLGMSDEKNGLGVRLLKDRKAQKRKGDGRKVK